MQSTATKINLAAARLVGTIGVIALGVVTASFVVTLVSPVVPEASERELPRMAASSDPVRTGPLVADVIASLETHNPWEPVPEVSLPESPAQPAADASTSGLQLIGTMVLSSAPSWAVLTRTGNQAEQLTLQIGDRVDGATLEDIARSAVYFRRGARLEVVTMAEEHDSRASPTVANRPGPGTVTLDVSRGHYEALLSQGSNWFKSVNLVPYYEGARTVGYQLKLAQHSPAFDQFGISNGDVIRKLNGIPITETGRLMQLFGDSRSISQVDIDLLRNGMPRTVLVNIEG